MQKHLPSWPLLLILCCLFLTCSTKSQYKVSANSTTPSTITLNLTYTGSDEYYLKPTSPIIKHLTFTFHALGLNDFNIKITDSNASRFQVPQGDRFPTDPLKNQSFLLALAAYHIQITNDPFDFRVSRRINNATLFSTYQGEFIYSAYYLQIKTQIDSDYSYGFGERFNQNFRTKNGKWTIFNRDRGMTIDRGQGLQTYGYYPLYLQKQNNYFFHINYLRSSNAMDIIKQTVDNKYYLTYKVIGGIFDFRFILAQQSAQNAIQKFHIFLGSSAIPPFWSFGFHQCRWGYKNITYLQYVLRNYQANNLPLDVLWSDIDYMQDYQDFTINTDLFPLDKMKAITDKVKYVPIIDAGIKVNNGTAYNQGRNRGVFIKDPLGAELYGSVWPGKTTFVDFFNPNATKYWGDMLDILYQKVQFSGIWLDMNEYANFCNGPCTPPSTTSTFDYSKDIPYQPGADVIESHTIPLNSTHYNNIKQADVHVFGALLQTHATNVFLKSKNLRPFIITRSSTLGSNRFGFHWTGDNFASFQYLKSSLADNFIQQIYGFQMVGPDICGFGGNTTQQLCSRWFQLSPLYTFARNHNEIGSASQQPYALGDIVLKAAQTNLRLRYSLLKHYYSLFVIRKGYGSIINPLYFAFPKDPNNYIDEIADTHVLIGNNLLFTPILEKGATGRKVYFSTVNWHNVHTGQQYTPGTHQIENVSLTDPVPLFLREGSAIFMQNSSIAKSTKDLDNKFNLVAALVFAQKRSTETLKYYDASGVHISLADYNNDTLIDQCLTNTCQYVVTAVLKVTDSSKVLDINVGYVGGPGLNGQFIINQLTLLFDGKRIINVLESPLVVSGPSKFQVVIKEGSIDLGNLRVQMINSEEDLYWV